MRSRAGSDAQGRLLRKAASPTERAGWPGSVGAGRGDHAGRLRDQHDAAAVPSQRHRASARRRSAAGDPSRKPLPPQEAPTIGDRLTERSISWAWYARRLNQR